MVMYILSFVVATALATGWVAKKTANSLGAWFWLSIPLPVIALCILLCLPEKRYVYSNAKK